MKSLKLASLSVILGEQVSVDKKISFYKSLHISWLNRADIFRMKTVGEGDSQVLSLFDVADPLETAPAESILQVIVNKRFGHIP